MKSQRGQSLRQVFPGLGGGMGGGGGGVGRVGGLFSSIYKSFQNFIIAIFQKAMGMQRIFGCEILTHDNISILAYMLF